MREKEEVKWRERGEERRGTKRGKVKRGMIEKKNMWKSECKK